MMSRMWFVLALTIAAAGEAAVGAGLTPGNLAVVRVGDGVAPISGAAAPAFVQEIPVGGGVVSTIGLPTVGSGPNRRLTVAGSATSEGYLTLSDDGNYLVMVGYDAAVGTASIATSATASVNRVIGRVSLSDRSVDTSTYFNATAYNAGNIRSACSVDGSAFWASGTGSSNSGGVWYTLLGPQGGASVQLSISVTNTRNVDIVAGELYVSSMSGAFRGVNRVGIGLPTTSGQTISLLPGFDASTSSPQSVYDYWFASPSTLYVADDRAVASGGGIQKWTLNGATWQLAYTMASAPGGSVRGLTGYVDAGGNAVLFATTSETSANRIVTVSDAGAGSPFTTIATAPASTVYRGIRYLPAPACAPAAIDADPESVSVCAGQEVSFTVRASGTAPLSYQWRLDGVDIDGATASTFTIVDAIALDAGDYDVVVTNACGSAASAVAELVIGTGPHVMNGPADKVAPLGASVVLTASATTVDPPLSYQWRKDGVDLADGASVSGAATDTLTISPVDFADAGLYDALVHDACGYVVTASATLTVVCAADLDADGDTDQSDLGILLADYGCAGCRCPGDVDGDGDTDQFDLGILLAGYGCEGRLPPPAPLLEGQDFSIQLTVGELSDVLLTILQTPAPFEPEDDSSNYGAVGPITHGVFLLSYTAEDLSTHELSQAVEIDNVTMVMTADGTPVSTMADVFPVLPAPPATVPGALSVSFDLPVQWTVELAAGQLGMCLLVAEKQDPTWQTDKPRQLDSKLFGTDGRPGRPDLQPGEGANDHGQKKEDTQLKELKTKAGDALFDTVAKVKGGKPTDSYNCHGYTFTDSERWFGLGGNAQKLTDAIKQILADNGYEKVGPGTGKKAVKGDLAVYTDGGGQITHTGLVDEVDDAGVPTKVVSKMGRLGLYRHKPADVPKVYEAGDPAYWHRAGAHKLKKG
jgi:hypothetical protein